MLKRRPQSTRLLVLVAAACLLGYAASPCAAREDEAPDLARWFRASSGSFAKEAAVRLSLAEAVREAVANNPSILAKAETPVKAREDIRTALAVYEPTFTAELSLSKSKVPTGNVLSGSEILKQDERKADFGLSKLVRSGAQLGLAWTNLRASTNSSFQGLVPQYTPTLGLNFDQPLLRNLGASEESTALSTAKNAAEHADADFEIELSDFVMQVIDTYWDASLADADVEVQQRSLDLARELVRKAEAMVEVGRQPPVAAREAQAEAALREEGLIASQNDLRLASRRLQFLVQPRPRSGQPMLRVIPVEKHPVRDLHLDRRSSLDRAFKHRAELKRARIELVDSILGLRNARNQELPAFNLFGNYFLRGLGGNGQPIGSPPQVSKFDGSYGDALDILTSGDFYSFVVGFRLEVPLANSAAEARVGRSQAERRRAMHGLQEAATEVALDVEETVGNVESAFHRVAAARLARELADENLGQERRRFDLGLVTTTDVLDFHDRLTRASAAEIRAKADHAKALHALYKAEGTLLAHFGVNPQAYRESGDPWWSRF